MRGKIRRGLSYLSPDDSKDWVGARPTFDTDILFAKWRDAWLLSTTVLAATQGKGSNLVGSYPHWPGPGMAPLSLRDSEPKPGPEGMSLHSVLILVMPGPRAGPGARVCFPICCGDRDTP